MKSNAFNMTTPLKNQTPLRIQREKRFIRKPNGSSQRSSSKKSLDSSSIKDFYIKSPTASIKIKDRQEDFFVSLASSILKTQQGNTDKKSAATERYKPQQTQRSTLPQWDQTKLESRARPDGNQNTFRNLNVKIRTLEAELDLKNHQASILSSQCQRLKKNVQQQKEKRRRIQNQKKQVLKQLKQVIKSSDLLKIQFKKVQKQKQQYLKQIQFLERINFDDKTRSLQSYRQSYLEEQLQKIRKQFHKSRGERQSDLENHIKVLKQQKYTSESHVKALKVANQCLIKQINNYQEGLQDIVMNSEEYKKLRDKYIRFLEEYKLLRNQYWALKAQVHQKRGGSSADQSEIFSITASQVQNDLSQLKIAYQGSPILQHMPLSTIQQQQKVKHK